MQAGEPTRMITKPVYKPLQLKSCAELCPTLTSEKLIQVSLERHKRSAHSGSGSGKVWACSECEFVSGSKYEYVLHSNKQHSG